MTNTDERRQQVAEQCRVVAHLATALAEIHSDYAKLFRQESPADDLIDMIGKRTSFFMETLGDMLNGMDAASESDGWVAPIFAKANELWPQKPKGR